MYDDLILNTFYDKNHEYSKTTNAYKVMNNYHATREQCQDKSRWPEKFPNIDIINRYVNERYPGARNLLECIYRLTVERGLEEGVYCQHCGKLLWYINWHGTQLKKFCSDECKNNDEDYLRDGMLQQQLQFNVQKDV